MKHRGEKFMKKKSFKIKGKKYTLRTWVTVVYNIIKYALIALLVLLAWVMLMLAWTDTHHELVNSYNQSVLALEKVK
jgi:glycopeptide antibiotics resistance protein